VINVKSVTKTVNCLRRNNFGMTVPLVLFTSNIIQTWQHICVSGIKYMMHAKLECRKHFFRKYLTFLAPD